MCTVGGAALFSPYQDFYSYPTAMDTVSGQLMVVGEDAPAALVTSGMEMVVGRQENGSGGQVIGSRSMTVYYRQKFKPTETREEVLINQQLVRCVRPTSCALAVCPYTGQPIASHRITFIPLWSESEAFTVRQAYREAVHMLNALRKLTCGEPMAPSTRS